MGDSQGGTWGIFQGDWEQGDLTSLKRYIGINKGKLDRSLHLFLGGTLRIPEWKIGEPNRED